jgi:hypothetical protein
VHGGGAGWLRWSGKSAMPQEASPRWVDALGPAHEDGRHMRRLGTDEAAEIEASATVMAYRRRTWRWCGRDIEGGLLYSHALQGGNTGLRREVAVAVALRGGDAEGVCPYAVGSGELARGWRWTGPRGKRACASTPCLCDERLGSWRARRGRTQFQQRRRKQRRNAGPCRWVLGAGITAASNGADQHRLLSGEVTPQCINARDDNTEQQGV